jgi:phosphate acetyltransferase
MGFMDEIIEQAKKKRKTIVLPEASDKRIIEAASRVISEDIADIILIGKKEKIYELAEGKDL